MNVRDIFLIELVGRNRLNITVKGISMYPTLKSGDKVKITKFNRKPHIGDIVLFKRDDDYILHRIIYIKDEFVLTKGDNNPYADHPINIDSIIGIAIDISNKTIMEQMQNKKRTINIWRTENRDLIDAYSRFMNLEVVFCPEAIDNSNINIAIMPEAMASITQIEPTIWEKDNIVFHMCAPISNFPCEGMILDKYFDGIYRSGTYLSSYKMTQIEQVLILFTEIITLGNYYETANNFKYHK